MKIMLKTLSLLCLVSITLILLFGCCAYTNPQNTQQKTIETKLTSKTFSLSPGQVYYYGGDYQTLDGIAMYRYIVQSSDPVQIYVVESKSDFQLIGSGNEFVQYPSCKGINILKYDQTCTISQKGGIAIMNADPQNSVVVSLTVYSGNLAGLTNQENTSDTVAMQVNSTPNETFSDTPTAQLNQEFCSKIQPTSPTVRDAAASVAGKYSGNWNIGQLYAIYQYIKSNVSYVSSPAGGNYLANASETLQVRAGNCENQAILAVSMIRSIGGTAHIAIYPKCNHAFALTYIGTDEQLHSRGNKIAELYGQEKLTYYSIRDKDGVNWLVFDTAGGQYLGDLLPECQGTQPGSYTLNC